MSSSNDFKDFSGPQALKRVHRFVSDDYLVRVAAVDATQVVEEARVKQSTFPVATVALGRAMIGAILMASHLKDQQEVSLDFQVSGPLHRIYAQASAQGGVRGYISEPQAPVNLNGEVIKLKESVGIGILSVSTFLPYQEFPHRGVVPVYSGEIGEDLAYYYEQSFQIPTIVSVGVHLDSQGHVNAAGGLIVELMPGANIATIELLEKNLAESVGVSQKLSEGENIIDIVRQLTQGLTLKELDHPHPVHYSCPCSQERVLRSLSLLGMTELKDVVQKGESLKTQCQMCGQWYLVSIEEVQDLMEQMEKQNLH